MRSERYLLLFLSGLLLDWGCQPKARKQEAEKTVAIADSVQYAQRFTIAYYDGYKKLTVKNPWKGATKDFTYLLYHDSAKVVGIKADAKVQIPIHRIVCESTSHLYPLIMLGVDSTLVGFADTSLMYAKSLRKRTQAGKIQSVGQQMRWNMEKLLKLQPDVTIGYAMQAPDEQLKDFNRAGLPYVLNADYLETNALGRAEWLKFFAAFYDKEALADSLLHRIYQRYDSLKMVAQQTKTRPTVMSGVMYGDIWYLPGGQSWAAQFIKDAGGHYLWAKTDGSGSLTKDFETVYAKANEAAYWINAANFSSLAAMKEADERYSYFAAFKEGNVFTYTKRTRPNGSNDYLESGYMRPDRILEDLLHILHPELGQDSTFYYEKVAKP